MVPFTDLAYQLNLTTKRERELLLAELLDGGVLVIGIAGSKQVDRRSYEAFVQRKRDEALLERAQRGSADKPNRGADD